MKILAIIPARGGSKGVKRKNIRSVGGLPLISYSIKAARESKLLTNFIVSTEDIEIADISKKFEAEVILRPPEIAEDKTPMLDVIKHVFSVLEKSNQTFDAGMILQPTAPLRTAADVDESIRIFKNKDCESLVSVYQVSDCHPARMYRIENGLLSPLEKEAPARLRQDLPPVYHRNGAIYIFSKSLLQRDKIISDHPLPYIMPREKSINIDDEIDLEFANFILSRPGFSK